MKRLLFDTNIYGLIVEKREKDYFQKMLSKQDIIICGCSIIRKELRDTPKKEKTLTDIGIKNLRITLLDLYDAVTKSHDIMIDKKTKALANKYLERFSELTRKTAIGHLTNDFMLVACATINNLDLIVSEDHKTLLSIEAIRTYNFVNGMEGLKLPGVFTYEEFKTLIKRLFPL